MTWLERSLGDDEYAELDHGQLFDDDSEIRPGVERYLTDQDKARGLAHIEALREQMAIRRMARGGK